MKLSPVLLLLLAGAAAGLGLPGGQYVSCECSATERGYRKGAEEDLTSALQALADKERSMRDNTPPASENEIAIELASLALQKWRSCVSSYSHEECVNADQAHRLGPCRPKCASFCFYNPGTWKTIAGGRLNPSCSASQFASTDADLINKTNPSDFRETPPNPNPAAAGTIKLTTPTPKTPGSEPASPAPTRTPTPGGDAAAGSAAGSGAGAAAPSPGASQPGAILEPAPTGREGCVAVEHLRGYVLQHRADLWRPVLCAHGFCATPNHAIIVGGELTSMRRLCAREWKCVRSEKFVNNLKLAANRRAVVSDLVTVTPYDIRFPKWAVWVVQMLEDAFELVVLSASLGGAAVVGLLFVRNVLTKGA